MGNIDNDVIKIVDDIADEKYIDNETQLNTKLIELGIDSLRFIRLIVQLEEEFDIEFDDNDLMLENFKDIQMLITYISDRKRNQ